MPENESRGALAGAHPVGIEYAKQLLFSREPRENQQNQSRPLVPPGIESLAEMLIRLLQIQQEVNRLLAEKERLLRLNEKPENPFPVLRPDEILRVLHPHRRYGVG